MTKGSHLVFRCDASPTMGSGHVMRCLTLADVWRQDFGGMATFCIAQLSGSLADRIQDAGHHIIQIDDDNGMTFANLCAPLNPIGIVIDGYHFDRDYREPLTLVPTPVATFRDSGSETFGADLIIDTSPLATAPKLTDGVVRDYACGTDYALVSPSILAARKTSKKPQGILITFGSSDPHSLSTPVASAIRAQCDYLPIHVILGGSVTATDEVVRDLSSLRHLTVSQDLPSIGPAIAAAELVITAAGSTLFEVAAIGRPMMLVVTEDNQSKLGTINWAKTIDVRELPEAASVISEMVVHLFHDKDAMTELCQHASRIVDGKGAHRVLKKIRALG